MAASWRTDDLVDNRGRPTSAAPKPGAVDRMTQRPVTSLRNWGVRSWGQAAAEAPSQIGPSAKRDVRQAVASVPQAATQLARTALRDPTASPLSRVEASLVPGMPHTATLQDAWNVGKQAAGGLYDRYLAPGAAQRTLATDPTGMAFDVGSLIAGGGEGAAAALSRLPQTGLRDAAIAAARTTRFANPGYLAGKAAGATARGVQGAIRGPIFDSAGDWTPQARTAATKAGIAPADMENPKFKPVLANAYQKGVNEASARQAVLDYHGADAPRPTVTQRPLPDKGPVATGVPTVRAQGHAKINQQISAIAGDDPARQAAVASGYDPTTGDFDPTRAIRTGLFDPTTPGAFPQEASDLRLAGTAKDVLNAPPTPGATAASSLPSRVARGAVGAGLGTLALSGASHVLNVPDYLAGLGPFAGLATAGGEAAIGALGEQFVEPWAAKGWRTQQIKGGAPTSAGWLDLPAAAGDTAAATGLAAPVVRPVLPQPPSPSTSPSWQPTEQPDIDLDAPDAPKPGPPAKGAAPQVWRDDDLVPGAPVQPPASDEKPTDDQTYDLDAPDPEDRAHHAGGGQVVSMVDRLMARAEREGKATRSATKPFLGLSDDTVAKALHIAQQAI